MPNNKIIQFIDFFYPPFRKLMPEQTFRYAVCGGTNTIISIIVFNVFNKFVFKEQNVDFGFEMVKSHNAALFASFCISFTIGFILLKFVVFVDSNLKGRVQLIRYFLSFLVNLILSYFFLKIFVETFHLNATIAQLITTVIVIAISFLSQKYFTFKIQEK